MNRVLKEIFAGIALFASMTMFMARWGMGPRTVQLSAIYEYDFAVDVSTVGTRNLRLIAGDANPPLGAILAGKDVAIDVLTALTGATATVGLQFENAGDVQAAAAISGAPWSTTGMKDPTIEAPLKLAVGGPLQIVIGTAALTAGKFRVYVSYQTMS